MLDMTILKIISRIDVFSENSAIKISLKDHKKLPLYRMSKKRLKRFKHDLKSYARVHGDSEFG